eukprot:EG_transcript_6732
MPGGPCLLLALQAPDSRGAVEAALSRTGVRPPMEDHLRCAAGNPRQALLRQVSQCVAALPGWQGREGLPAAQGAAQGSVSLKEGPLWEDLRFAWGYLSKGHVTPPLVGSTHTGLGRATRRGPSFAAFVSLMEALLRLYVPGLRVEEAEALAHHMLLRDMRGQPSTGPLGPTPTPSASIATFAHVVQDFVDVWGPATVAETRVFLCTLLSPFLSTAAGQRWRSRLRAAAQSARTQRAGAVAAAAVAVAAAAAAAAVAVAGHVRGVHPAANHVVLQESDTSKEEKVLPPSSALLRAAPFHRAPTLYWEFSQNLRTRSTLHRGSFAAPIPTTEPSDRPEPPARAARPPRLPRRGSPNKTKKKDRVLSSGAQTTGVCAPLALRGGAVRGAAGAAFAATLRELVAAKRAEADHSAGHGASGGKSSVAATAASPKDPTAVAPHGSSSWIRSLACRDSIAFPRGCQLFDVSTGEVVIEPDKSYVPAQPFYGNESSYYEGPRSPFRNTMAVMTTTQHQIGTALGLLSRPTSPDGGMSQRPADSPPAWLAPASPLP